MSIKRRTWEILEAAKAGDRVSRGFDCFILALIVLNVLAVILGSVEEIEQGYGVLLAYFEVFSVIVFTVEYLLRCWSCVVQPEYARPVTGRVRFALKAMSLVDLLAILPFYLPFFGIDLRFLRILRLMRIIRVVKVARYYHSLQLIRNVIKAKQEELVLSTFVMLLLLITSACLMYYCENQVQPEAFSNIPETMWWSVATLTTVGYGDVYPVTVAGRFLASIIAMLGIGMFALPTGILGAGFVEEIQKRKSRSHQCPHCGKPIPAGQFLSCPLLSEQEVPVGSGR